MDPKNVYNPIADLYESFSDSAAQINIEIRTILNLAGDIQGKSVLDLACGYGLFSRLFRNHGASKVVGVDISHNMIEIAKSKSQQYDDNIEFHVRDACNMESFGKFDLIIAAWLFCNTLSLEDLEMMFRSVAKNLAPNGKLIAYTIDPDYRLVKGNCINYRVNILSQEPWKEGAFVKAEFLTTPPSPFTMYQWSREQHKEACNKAGLTQLEWHKPTLLQSDIDSYPPGFWDDFQNNCHDIAFVCQF
ncbi:class I SAM-dependent methyltransferase [Xenorhabdus budapestensis]|uniref:Class I SAM-dependent methyltransferase n=1 Tax=Xenorhabdus budapestensis TaxID=290110 RepID=A0ABX7VGH1_XENBU|nr:class I SAM-dependent methyltransferase [Xenorhabdus budapestensis]QTL38892.1 class I SAM-dependent methyltransferase [Xenorhabdus budapestensis]